MSQPWLGCGSKASGSGWDRESLLSQPDLWELPSGAGRGIPGANPHLESPANPEGQTLATPDNLPEPLGFPGRQLLRPYSQELASTCWHSGLGLHQCGSNGAIPKLHMLAERKEAFPDGRADLAPCSRRARRLAPNPGWLTSSVSSPAVKPLAGHGMAAHTMLGVIQPVITSGQAVQGGKGFQSQPSHISVRSSSPCHRGGLDHAMLLTPGPVE